MHSTLKTLLENPIVINPPNNMNCVDEKKDADWSENFDVTSAFLGPTLWSKTLPYDDGLKLDYMDLDELLSQSDIHNGHSTLQLTVNEKTVEDQRQHPCATNVSLKRGGSKVNELETWKNDCKMIKVDVDFPPEDLALALAPGQTKFDPTNHKFTEDELKPQPMCKKSKKKLVPSDMKDEKYWSRRKKNNVAAKRSRDVRRAKENQIVLRASFLEKENNTLKDQVAILQKENQLLLEKIQSLMK